MTKINYNNINFIILVKKLAVFDLDETLVHCKKTDLKNAEVHLEVKLENGKLIKIGINIRPFIFEALKKIQEYKYDIVIYTASQSNYADVVLDYIDSNKDLFSLRLYRQNCIKTLVSDEFIYIKDLRVFHLIDLCDIIIIDNSALSFALHLDNGIPILPFYDNKNDNELMILANYLKELSNSEDISVSNRKFMKYYHETSSEDDQGENSKKSDISLNQTNNAKNKSSNQVTDDSYITENDLEFSVALDNNNDNCESEKSDTDQSRKLTIRKSYDEFIKTFR